VGGSSIEEVTTEPGAAASFRGFVLAMNKRDGTNAWKKLTVEPPSNGATIWSTLSVDEAAGVVFASTANNYTGVASDTSDAFLALALAGSPSFLWKQQMVEGAVFTSRQSNGNPEADFGANPILFEVGGRKLAAGGNKGGDFWVLDRSNGAIVRRRNLGPGSEFKGGIFNSGAWDGRRLLVAVNALTSATLVALDPLTLDIVWERPVTGPLYSPISVAGGVGFFGMNTTLQAFDTATGDVLFEFATEGTIATAPAIAEGYVVFGSGMSWIQAVAGTKYYALRIP
jgi:polyvinyl alcohol dehydrogenase (cytochrome)